MDFRAEQQVSRAQQVLRRIQGDERFSVPALAASMGVPYDRLMSYVKGRAPFPADLAADLFAAIAEVDHSLALWALTEIAGLREIGLELKPTAQGLDADPIRVDLLQVHAALGGIDAKLAAMPGGDPQNYRDAGEILAGMAEAECQLKQARVKAEIIASITPQMKIPEVER